jgi:uncharacterized membrane protein YfcA
VVTLEVMAVLFLASLIRSEFGFGEALVAVPLLALVMPVEVAAPVAALVSITIAVVVLIQDWAEAHARSAAWLVLATVPGIPLGLLLLTHVAAALVKAVLASVIICFSAWSLMRKHASRLEDDRFAWMFGFLAGVLGGAYGMNGPPLVIYGALRGWTPTRFRATLQGYFLPASVLGMAGYWAAGLWTSSVSRCYSISLPAVILAIFLGRIVNRRLDSRRFLLYVHAGLILTGCVLWFQALHR